MDRRKFGATMFAGAAGLACSLPGHARALELTAGQVQIDVKFLQVVSSRTTSFGVDFDNNVSIFGAGDGGGNSGSTLSFNIGTGFGSESHNNHDRNRTGINLNLLLGGSNSKAPDIDTLIRSAMPAGQVGYDRANGSIILAPRVSVRRIDTAVILNVDEAIVIGGLLKARRSNTESEIPNLSKIPLIGSLFKSEYKYKNRQTLLVFITPTIFRTPESKTLRPRSNHRLDLADDA